MPYGKDKVKGRYEDKFGSFMDQEIDQDDMKFIVTRGVTPSTAALEQSLTEVKGLYECGQV